MKKYCVSLVLIVAACSNNSSNKSPPAAVPVAAAHVSVPSADVAVTPKPISTAVSVAKLRAQKLVIVTSRELYAAYNKGNEVAADNAYKDKPLNVTGIITSIEKDYNHDIVVKLQGGVYDHNSVNAYDIPADVASKLQKGQKITLSCLGAGLLTSDPTINDCHTI